MFPDQNITVVQAKRAGPRGKCMNSLQGHTQANFAALMFYFPLILPTCLLPWQLHSRPPGAGSARQKEKMADASGSAPTYH